MELSMTSRPSTFSPVEPEVFVHGEGVGQFGFVRFDELHRLLDGRGQVFLLRSIHKIVVAGFFGQVKPTLFYGYVLYGSLVAFAFDSFVFVVDVLFDQAVLVIRELEEDETEHGCRVF